MKEGNENDDSIQHQEKNTISDINIDNSEDEIDYDNTLMKKQEVEQEGSSSKHKKATSSNITYIDDFDFDTSDLIGDTASATSNQGVDKSHEEGGQKQVQGHLPHRS